MSQLCTRPLQALTVIALLVAGIGCGGGSTSSTPSTPPVTTPPMTQLTLTQLSTDPFTNSSSQHATEVEAGTAAFGSTIVSAFQVGRIFDGGAADIGYATSTDSGATWTNGVLPGTTIFENGTYSAISDPAVAYDAAHGVWIICTLPITATDKVAVSLSSDGINWGNPILVSATPDADKNWITCDNTPSSPYYGHCYVEWDDPSNNGVIWMSTSTDGGLTWGSGKNSANLAAGIGGQPVVQPNGTVVVPIEAWTGSSMIAFTSTDGGNTWNSSVLISTVTDHLVAGNLRTSPLPAAQVDSSGTVYVIWQDCRFRSGCGSNDLVLSTSTDGNTWTTPARIPIDSSSSTVDHFIPGLAVDPATSGSSAHLALTYYFYPTANCTASTCALALGFISSQDGGLTWSSPTTIVSSMSLATLPNTFAGLMVGDYCSTAFAGGKAFGIFAVANPLSGSLFDEPMYTTTGGITVSSRLGVASSIGERALASVHSDHPPRHFYDQEEHRYPVRPPKD